MERIEKNTKINKKENRKEEGGKINKKRTKKLGLIATELCLKVHCP